MKIHLTIGLLGLVATAVLTGCQQPPQQGGGTTGEPPAQQQGTLQNQQSTGTVQGGTDTRKSTP